jgi:regulator of sirC expression with transglutaminase-like and TPR domain
MSEDIAPMQRWSEIAGRPEDDIDLAEAALVIASQEYQNLDVSAYLARIDGMAESLQRRMRADISPADTIVLLNHYLFEELGFSGNSAEYYDPRNSFLNEVLDRRTGIPITLSLLYIEIGRRVGLQLQGVSFPAHFLVRCATHEGIIVLDPYAKGASLGMDELQRRVRELAGGVAPDPGRVKAMLAAADKREILSRMLRNLKDVYLRRKEPAKALAASDRIIALAPGNAEEFRERGQIYLGLECFRAALDDFRHYLWLNPQADDAALIGMRVAELRRIAATLN